MRRWAFLFRPGWLALALVVVAFAYLCFTVLAPWQLGKNTRTSRENNQIATSLTADPVPVTSLLSQSDSAQWRRVTATGHYVAGATVLARLRVVDGEPAFEVLTPFVIDAGPTILVDRGYAKTIGGLAGAAHSAATVRRLSRSRRGCGIPSRAPTARIRSPKTV